MKKINRKINIYFPVFNKKITAKLLQDINPEICDELWKSLPYCSTNFHTMVSGKNIYHIVPNIKPHFGSGIIKENRISADVGTIFMYNPRNILIKYGEGVEERYFPPVAKVINKDISTLQEIGQLSWELAYNNKNINKIILLKKDSKIAKDYTIKDFKFQLASLTKTDNPDLKKIIEKMNQEIKDIWITPPEELLATYQNTYKENFPKLVFLEGEVRHLVGLAGIGVIDTIIKACSDPQIELESLKKILIMSIDDSSKFIGFCGLKKFRSFIEEIISNVYTLNKEEFLLVLSLLSLYGSKLHEWNLTYFPWKK